MTAPSPMDRSIHWRPDIPKWEVSLFYSSMVVTIAGIVSIPFWGWLAAVIAWVGLGVIATIRLRDLRIRRSRMDQP